MIIQEQNVAAMPMENFQTTKLVSNYWMKDTGQIELTSSSSISELRSSPSGSSSLALFSTLKKQNTAVRFSENCLSITCACGNMIGPSSTNLSTSSASEADPLRLPLPLRLRTLPARLPALLPGRLPLPLRLLERDRLLLADLPLS